MTEDTKIPNAATIKVVKQDHTLANMVRGCVLSTLLSLPSPAWPFSASSFPCHRFFSLAIKSLTHSTHTFW